MRRLCGHLGLALLCGTSSGGAVAAGAPHEAAQRLYAQQCAICHAPGWDHPGYNRLRQRGGGEPDLTARHDLTRDFVRVIVRQGIGSMPAFPLTHLSDDDLTAIAGYLARQE